MKSRDWENHDEGTEPVPYNVNEVIDLLRQALETSDMLFVERALNVLEGNEGYDDQFDDGYDQFVDDTN